VIEVTPVAIRVKSASGSVLSFYRKPKVDYRLVFETQLKLIRNNYPGGCEEPKLRAIEWAVSMFRDNNPYTSFEDAKAAVLAAIGTAP
jgi:hypothetical protein